MAATGATPISLYYSSTTTNVPTAGNLVAGELALNTADGKLFYKDSSNVVQVIGTKGGVGTSSTTQVLYNSSGLVVGSANLTFNGTTLTTANDASISGLTVGKGNGSVSGNVAVGTNALQANTGLTNTAVGSPALYSNTSGTLNVAVGVAMYSNTTGSNNVGIGHQALNSNTTANSNVAVGYQSLYTTNATNMTSVGYQALLNAGANGDSTALGYQAGSNLTTGYRGLYLGSATVASAVGAISETVVGYGLTGKGSNTAYIGGSSGAYQQNNSAAWSITSDARLKKNIVDNTIGLSAITAIQVRNFEYRTKDEITDLPNQYVIGITGEQIGAIAQELQVILPDCVKTESTGVMSIDASNLTWYLVNAVKELNAKVTALEAQLSKP